MSMNQAYKMLVICSKKNAALFGKAGKDSATKQRNSFRGLEKNIRPI